MNSHNNTHLHSGSPHHSSIQSALDACYRSNRPEQLNLHIQSLRASKIVRAHCNSAAADHSTFCAASSPSLLNFMTLYPPVWPLSPIITPASNSAPALSPDPVAKHGQPTALAQCLYLEPIPVTTLFRTSSLTTTLQPCRHHLQHNTCYMAYHNSVAPTAMGTFALQQTLEPSHPIVTRRHRKASFHIEVQAMSSFPPPLRPLQIQSATPLCEPIAPWTPGKAQLATRLDLLQVCCIPCKIFSLSMQTWTRSDILVPTC